MLLCFLSKTMQKWSPPPPNRPMLGSFSIWSHSRYKPGYTNPFSISQRGLLSQNNTTASKHFSSPYHNEFLRRSFCQLKSPVREENAEAKVSEEADLLSEFESEVVEDMLPREVVAELDRYIVGQPEAKRAVAVSLRNRWRRFQLPQRMREEIVPKNILMIGPTGVGKTEIARRIAKLQDVPFIKVEATKFTEVGFHGKDVDTIIKDLADIAVTQTRSKLVKRVKEKIKDKVDNELLYLLVANKQSARDFKDAFHAGELESVKIEIDVPEVKAQTKANATDIDVLLVQNRTGKTKKKVMTIAEARPVVEQMEIDKLISPELIVKKAIQAVEQGAIVFIDEIDKICSPSNRHPGPEASAEGVQRDLLPIIEGTTIGTKHGNVDTSKILFIASGAFSNVKPSDMLPELQGRLPIRVELRGLKQQDLYKILTEPETNTIAQQIALMKTEGVTLRFTDAAVQEIARIAAEVNESVENIGARRLHTIIERIMEDINFNCDKLRGADAIIDQAYVKQHLGDMLLKTDLSKFVL